MTPLDVNEPLPPVESEVPPQPPVAQPSGIAPYGMPAGALPPQRMAGMGGGGAGSLMSILGITEESK